MARAVSLNAQLLFSRLKYSKILSRVLLIQIIVPLSPAVEAAAEVANVLKAFRFQIIRDHERKPSTGADHQNLLVLWELIQVFFYRKRWPFMRVRQAFVLSPVVFRAYIQNVGF